MCFITTLTQKNLRFQMYLITVDIKKVEELLHKCKDIEKFSDKLRSATMYYFWSKCEWETVIYPWIGDEKAAKKIDVFWQLQNNWSRFVEYLWDMSVKK